MKWPVLFCCLLFAGVVCGAQSGDLSSWQKLIGKCDVNAAKTLCTSFLDSKKVSDQVEAHKCLANVALCGNSMIMLEGDNAGGGNLRGSYTSEAADDALAHLNAAMKLDPNDLSVHMGRLHLLEVTGRYGAMVKALDESCTLYQGKGVPDAWLDYSPEFMELRQYESAVDFMKVLNKHYPDNSDILGNLGAFLDLLRRESEAIPYLEKAVSLAPQDAINTWDLARAYDYANQDTKAQQWYEKGLSLMTDPAQLKESRCIYGTFLETKMHDRARACKLEKQNCEKDKRSACAASAGKTAAAK